MDSALSLLDAAALLVLEDVHDSTHGVNDLVVDDDLVLQLILSLLVFTGCVILVVIEEYLEVVVHVLDQTLHQVEGPNDEPDSDQEEGVQQVALHAHDVVDESQVNQGNQQRLVDQHLSDEEHEVLQPEDHLRKDLTCTKHHVVLEDAEQ